MKRRKEEEQTPQLKNWKRLQRSRKRRQRRRRRPSLPSEDGGFTASRENRSEVKTADSSLLSSGERSVLSLWARVRLTQMLTPNCQPHDLKLAPVLYRFPPRRALLRLRHRLPPIFPPHSPLGILNSLAVKAVHQGQEARP
jgi:hypothetical protein